MGGLPLAHFFLDKKTQSATFLDKCFVSRVSQVQVLSTHSWVVAQLVEQRIKSVLYLCRMLAEVASLAHNQEVVGSNPSPAPNKGAILRP